MRAWKSLRCAIHLEDGQAMVETAVSILLTIIVCFWLFEFSMLAYTYSVLNEATHEGVHYAITHGSDSSLCSGPTTGCGDTSATNVVNIVKTAAAASLHDMTAMKVTVSYPESSCKPSSLVTVTVAYSYLPYVNLAGLGTSVNMTAQGRIVY